MNTWLRFIVLAALCLSARLMLACGAGDIVNAPDGEYKAIDKTEAVDFKWVPRTLKKAPDLKSAKPRYVVVVLGEGRQSSVALVFDESKGTGTGYDTLYADTNYNGDLTDAGEKFTPTANKFDLGTLKDADGESSFTLAISLLDGTDLKATCLATVKTSKGSFTTETCFHYTGGLHTVADLKSAPVYHLHGDVVPIVIPPYQKGVVAGAHLGPYRVGDAITLGFQVSILGSNLVGNDLANRFDFFWAGFPAPKGESSPSARLRVKDKDNRLIEELSFTGGGG